MQPLIDYRQGDSPLVLSPANGFPPLVYQNLLQRIPEQFHIYLAEHRPIWAGAGNPPKNLNWKLLAQDLIEQIEQAKLKPVTLVGHSLGAVLGLMAATQKPELFERLILMEPVFFPAHRAFLLKWLPWSYKQKIPMVAKTLGRPHSFKTAQSAFKFHRRTKAFAKLSDEALSHYIEYGFCQQGELLNLRYCKQWEAAIYASLPNVWPFIKKVNVPVTGFRAEHSNTLHLPEWQRWKKLRPDHQLVEFSGAEHLLPLTEPERVAEELIRSLLSPTPYGSEPE